jgi:hypothetical protein
MALSLPSSFGSQALFSTYYLAQPDDYTPLRVLNAFEEAEMDAAMALVPRDEITKLFAVDAGNWNTAGNWYPSGVPGFGAIVCIPEGCVCTYNLNAPLTELFTVRLDGILKTDPAIDTAMLFDTMVITQMGRLQDGTRAHRVDHSKVHQWIIATSNGDIDVTWDTFFQSRGIISLGTVDVWGAFKTPFLKVVSPAGPVASATSLTLASEPTNWKVGDDIVVCATQWRNVGSFGIQNPDRNDRRTLTSSSGTALGWTGGLTYSHQAPVGTTNRTDCAAYVMNLTRNVVFRPDDIDALIRHRGHMMQMHNPAGWSMRNAEIADLGRTSKMAGLFNYLGCIHHTVSSGIAARPLNLSSSPYWNAGSSQIEFGATHQVYSRATSGSRGTLTIEGTDEDGNSQSEVMNYLSGDRTLVTRKYFLTVDNAEYSTRTDRPFVGVLARGRQLNENGVRDLKYNYATGLDETTVYTAIKNTVNIQGRYPFHWHKLGVLGDILLDPPVLDGCSFHGSPGWLVAQHQTHGVIKNCVGFDAQGAGLVGEDGNETGIWQDCLMAGIHGNNDTIYKDNGERAEKDPAVPGTAYWFTGRGLHVRGSIAAGCQGGFIYNVRLQNVQIKAEQYDQPTVTRGRTTTDVDDINIGHFEDCTTYAAQMGFLVVKANSAQGHDIRTVVKRFKAVSCQRGAEFTYTSNYLVLDADVLNDAVSNVGDDAWGLITGINTTNISFVNPVVEGLKYGFNLDHDMTDNSYKTLVEAQRIIINPTFRNITTSNYVNHDANIDLFLATGDLNSDPLVLGSITDSGGTNDRSITGVKHDSIGDVAHPHWPDTYTYLENPDILNIIQTKGYYTDATDGHKYLLNDEWFTSRVTGLMNKVIVPMDITTGYSLTGAVDKGVCDLVNKTGPTMADFSVSLTRNTSKEIDLFAVANVGSGALKSISFQCPMKTKLVDIGNGTITAIPLNDENYTETCYVWVDDVNGNTTRATMTIRVNH